MPAKGQFSGEHPLICIVTPGQLGMNPRVVKEADTLVKAGYRVHVISTRLNLESEERDLDILSRAKWSAVRVDFTHRKRWFLERALTEVYRKIDGLVPSSRTAPVSHSPITRRLAKAVAGERADLYIAHYVAALPAVVGAAKKYGVPYAFDAEDFHPGDLPSEPESIRPNRWIASIEREALRNACYVSAASPGIARAYQAEYGITRPTVIRNLFSKKEAPPRPTSAGSMRPRPAVYWFSQVRGTDRGLECVLEAISIAKSRPHLHIRGTPQTGFDESFRSLAEKLGCADQVHLLPPELPSKMVSLASQYDLGFVGETGVTHNRRIALTNKQFTYILAGLPVVMSEIPAHIEFAEKAPGAAFLFRNGDPLALAKILDELLGNPERLAKAREASWFLGQTELHWEAEAPRLVELVNRVLALDPTN